MMLEPEGLAGSRTASPAHADAHSARLTCKNVERKQYKTYIHVCIPRTLQINLQGGHALLAGPGQQPCHRQRCQRQHKQGDPQQIHDCVQKAYN